MTAVYSSGVAIHYDVTGEGPPLVLLHGGANDRSVWRPAGHLAPLSQEFRVVTIDLRGAGDSVAPVDESDHHMGLYVQDVLSVMDELALPDAFIWGVSMGGQVALALAASHPARVRALIIAGADLEGWSASPDDYRSFAESIALRGMPVVVEAFDDPHDPLPPWMRDAMLRTDPLAFAAAMRGRAGWPGVEGQLDVLRMPILFVGGESEYGPGILEAMAARVPQGRTLRVPRANHIQAFIDSRYVVPRAIEFLRAAS